MAKLKSETIIIKGDPILKEGEASEVLMPGHLIEVGGSKDFRKQTTLFSGECRRFWALENDLVGKDITEPYAVSERVRAGSFHKGQEVNARLAANAVAIVKGEAIAANGGGTVKKHTTGAVIGYAMESIDNHASSSEAFIVIEVA
jgi:hypothetical protein